MTTEATGGAAAPTGAAAPAVTATPTPAAAGAPALGEEYKAMTPAQFAERIAAATAQGAKGVLKDLGVEKLEDAKTRIDDAKKRSDAELTESQRHAARVKELEPKAANSERYEAALKAQLEAREKAVPADKKALLDELAPPATDPVARLDWLTKAEARGLFGTAAASTLSTTRAGGAAPPASANTGTQPKRPHEMTKEERVKAKAEAEAKVRALQTK